MGSMPDPAKFFTANWYGPGFPVHPHHQRAGAPRGAAVLTPSVIIEAAPRAEEAFPPRSLGAAMTGAAGDVQEARGQGLAFQASAGSSAPVA